MPALQLGVTTPWNGNKAEYQQGQIHLHNKREKLFFKIFLEKLSNKLTLFSLTNSLTLARLCEILIKSSDGKKAICIDKENKAAILAYIKQSERHLKKWRHIVELILQGHKNTDLYDKEEINDKCKGVTAMKFFKGQENDRIYCKEMRSSEGTYVIITAELYLKKKSDKVSKKEIPIIEKVGSYEYKIEHRRGKP